MAANDKKDIRQKEQAARREAFLRVYRECGVVGTTCRHLGLSRDWYYREREKDKAFAAAADAAFQDAVDDAEYELRRRAIEGVVEPVLFKGQPVYRRDPETGDLLRDENGDYIPVTVSIRSDRLLEVYTRSHRPIYKERSEVALTGADGGAVKNEIVIKFVESDGDGRPKDGD